MKALSLWQPWASAIAIGAKSIETRHWPTNYRGPLLIHAAKRGTKPQISPIIRELQLNLDIEVIPFGSLVGVCELVGCCNTESLRVTDQERRLGDYSRGRFGWILYGVRAFNKPIPFRGMQGIFNVPDDVVSEELRAIGWGVGRG